VFSLSFFQKKSVTVFLYLSLLSLLLSKLPTFFSFEIKERRVEEVNKRRGIGEFPSPMEERVGLRNRLFKSPGW
jgi:hypothetical protein